MCRLLNSLGDNNDTKEQVCTTSHCCGRWLSVPAAGALNFTIKVSGAGCLLSGTPTAGSGREENLVPNFDAVSAPHQLAGVWQPFFAGSLNCLLLS